MKLTAKAMQVCTMHSTDLRLQFKLIFHIHKPCMVYLYMTIVDLDVIKFPMRIGCYFNGSDQHTSILPILVWQLSTYSTGLQRTGSHSKQSTS